jgi:hypothetical protein
MSYFNIKEIRTLYDEVERVRGPVDWPKSIEAMRRYLSKEQFEKV